MQKWTCRYCGLVVYIKRDDPKSDEVLSWFIQHLMIHQPGTRKEIVEDLLLKLRPDYTISNN